MMEKLAQKPNSWMYNFVEVSGHNLESSQTWDFRLQCLHYKPVSNHFCSKGEGEENPLLEVTVNSKKENSFVPITSKNSAIGHARSLSLYLPSRTSCGVRSSWEGRYNPPIFSSLPLYVLWGLHTYTGHPCYNRNYIKMTSPLPRLWFLWVLRLTM